MLWEFWWTAPFSLSSVPKLDRWQNHWVRVAQTHTHTHIEQCSTSKFNLTFVWNCRRKLWTLDIRFGCRKYTWYASAHYTYYIYTIYIYPIHTTHSWTARLILSTTEIQRSFSVLHSQIQKYAALRKTSRLRHKRIPLMEENHWVNCSRSTYFPSWKWRTDDDAFISIKMKYAIVELPFARFYVNVTIDTILSFTFVGV